jgi:2-polyprenyl-3-methyl-5-hydroxy-6-metoxy-1,4-benzoquinol methylase
MTVFLRARALELTERMDSPDCDPALLQRTYAQFTTINAVLSGWGGLYQRYLKPWLRTQARTTRVLDIGCGGGDLLRRLGNWAAQDGLSATFVGIDPDPRAIAFARQAPHHSSTTYRQADSQMLVTAGETFDIVVSNHVLHHLSTLELAALCDDCEQLAQGRVVHNDIRRDDLAYALFPLAGLVCQRSFIVEDGLRSIRRSFTQTELEQLAPPGWTVEATAPFRLQLLWSAP